MAPDLEAKGPGSTEECPLLANVVAAHHEKRSALYSMCLTHHLYQAGYGIVLNPADTLIW